VFCTCIDTLSIIIIALELVLSAHQLSMVGGNFKEYMADH
jgi:hypothetical protein